MSSWEGEQTGSSIRRAGPSVLRVLRVDIAGEVLKQDLNKMCSSCPGVSFLGPGLYDVLVSARRGVHYPIQLALRTAMRIAYLVLLLFKAWS